MDKENGNPAPVSAVGEGSVRALNDAAKEAAFTDPRRAMELARQAYAAADAISDREGVGTALLNMGLCYFVLSDLSAARGVWEQARTLFHENRIALGEAQAINNIGNYYSRIGNSQAALDCYSTALELYRTAGNTSALASVQVNIGLTFKTLGNYPKALEHYRQALDTLEAEGDIPSQTHTLNNLGNIYLDLGDFSQAMENFTRSLAIARDTGNKRVEAMALNNIGNVQERLGNLDGAREYYLRSLELKQELGDRYGEGNALGNLGIVCQRMNDFATAVEYLNRSLVIFRVTGDREAEINALLNLAITRRKCGEYDVAVAMLTNVVSLEADLGNREGEATTLLELGQTWLDLGRTDEAEPVLRRALALAEGLEAKLLVAGAYLALSQLCRTTGDYRQALECYERYHTVQQEIYNSESDRRIQTLLVQLRMERTEKERELYRRKAELLEHDIEFKRRELASHTLNLVERNKLLTTVRRELERMAETVTPENRSRVQAILSTIRSNDSASTDWDIFSDKFQELHGEFMQNLSKLYPDLSPTELKICALTKVHLSTKEIASILHTSVRTVEAHRYRLRKKLDITGDVSLTSFLASL